MKVCLTILFIKIKTRYNSNKTYFAQTKFLQSLWLCGSVFLWKDTPLFKYNKVIYYRKKEIAYEKYFLSLPFLDTIFDLLKIAFKY